jgi:hypothetical protein
MLLTKESARGLRRPPKKITIASLGGAEAFIRPISALRHGEIDDQFPIDDTAGKTSAQTRNRAAAIVAEVVVDEAGNAIFTADELLGEFEAAVLQELQKAVAEHLFKDAPKGN